MKFQRVPWDSSVHEFLSAECGDDIDIIAEEVSRGVSRLWKTTHDDGGISYFVTRKEGQELVLVAYAGQELARTSAIIHSTAKAQGFTSIRAHTKRLAMLRLLRELNPHVTEYVARFFLTEDSDNGTLRIVEKEGKDAEQRKPSRSRAGFSRNGTGKRATYH